MRYDWTLHSVIHDSEEGGLGGMGGYLNFIFLFHGTNLAMGAGYAIEWEEDIDVNTKGEEPIAKAVGDGYEKIFKANSYLFKFLTQCLKKAK